MAHATKEGWLETKGFWGSWKPHWFTLHEKTLSWYSKKDAKKPSGRVQLESFLVQEAVRLTNKEHSFGIFVMNNKPLLLKATNKQEMLDWMTAINTCGVMTSLSLFETLECMNDAVVISDKTGTMVGFNPKAVELFGYSKPEAIGKNVEILMTDANSRYHARYMENYFKTGERRLIGIRRTLPARNKEGNLIMVDISLGEIAGPFFIATFRPAIPVVPEPSSPSPIRSPEGTGSGSSDEVEELKNQVRALMSQRKQLETENAILKSEVTGSNSTSGSFSLELGNQSIDLKDMVYTKDPTEIFELQQQLGRGAFGEVYKGVHKETGHPVAVKLLRQDIDLKSLVAEIDAIRVAKIPAIVKYYGAFVKDNVYWLVMEFCDGGSVKDLMFRMKSPLPEPAVAAVIQQTLKALEYVHSRGKIHRDIKAANLLLTSSGEVKLADFSISATIIDAARHTAVGSPYWMSPEMVEEKGHTYTTDVWSLGITAIELAEMQPPYMDMGPLRALLMVTSKDSPQLKNPTKWSPAFVDFVSNCLQKDPAKRASVAQLLLHPFLSCADKKPLITLMEEYPL